MRYIGYQSPDNEMPSMGDVFGDITDGRRRKTFKFKWGQD